MKLAELTVIKRSQKRLEIVGLGLANLVAGVFGILPLSLPIGRNLLALKAGATERYYLVLSCFLTVVFGFLIWPLMEYLPMITVSIFNAALGMQLLDPEVFGNYWKFSPKYASIFSLILLCCFFVDVTFCMVFAWGFFMVVYMQGKDEENFFEILDGEKFYREVLEFDKNWKEKEMGDEEGEGLVKDKELGMNLARVKARGVVYVLKGKFSFMFWKNHMTNLKYIGKEVVVLDFRDVIEDDGEFLQEYCRLAMKVMEEGFEIWVSGIPKERVTGDLFFDGTWVQEMNEQGRILYVS